MPICDLRPSDSPRLAGENSEHIQALAESPAGLPPIMVHRATMRVIDGMHRLRAAMLRGDNTIQVWFFDGVEAEAFVLGVRVNIAHGLSLSLADRRAAAARIVASHPLWSDRVIASVTGLSAKTVGGIRRCATGEVPQSRSRIGRDGRARPLSSADGRRMACHLLREDPSTSLRQVATASGISLSTVRDVRDRLARGEDPVPPKQRHREQSRRTSTEPAAAEAPPVRSGDRLTELLVQLKRDPSLHCSELGRALIRLLSMHALTEQERGKLLDAVPEHCRGVVAELALACAETWHEMALSLGQGTVPPMRRAKDLVH
ncbi:ParB-like nuclease domain-containing protein [Amycolatopsis sp. H6(2020)]|nr:ParB-like nuclease domain-containing protein [Amycolatopsis sp. H6(2020)]